MEMYCKETDTTYCVCEDFEFGYCINCGAVLRGSVTDYEIHGYDPPESVEV